MPDKSHLVSAIGPTLVENGHRVLMTRTTDLLQRLQTARRELTLEHLIARLDRFRLLIDHDFAYVRRDHAETSVLFELISALHERRSLKITANQPFSEWDGIFPDRTMAVAVAAVDRLVHRATILELNAECYRRSEAIRTIRRKASRPAPPDETGPEGRGRPAGQSIGGPSAIEWPAREASQKEPLEIHRSRCHPCRCRDVETCHPD